jgi:hypothetical protein
MIFNKHKEVLEGQHAILGGSQYSWINYDENKMADVYCKKSATLKGTLLHGLAEQLIRLGQKLPDTQSTLNMYVNDAIGYKMIPEQVLYYSENCFGTADAIMFRKNELRIHDYKSGSVLAHFEQLEIYAALFCLEYRKNPLKIKITLCIYQNDDVSTEIPDPDRISMIMDKIISFDKIIDKLKIEGV